MSDIDKAIEDAILTGTGFIKDDKRIDPRNVRKTPEALEIESLTAERDTLLAAIREHKIANDKWDTAHFWDKELWSHIPTIEDK